MLITLCVIKAPVWPISNDQVDVTECGLRKRSAHHYFVSKMQIIVDASNLKNIDNGQK